MSEYLSNCYAAVIQLKVSNSILNKIDNKDEESSSESVEEVINEADDISSTNQEETTL